MGIRPRRSTVYTVTVTKHGVWSLRATVINAKLRFNLTQRPLVFVAPHEKARVELWHLRTVRFDRQVTDSRRRSRAPFALHAEARRART